jgi:lipoprotein-anchoring transpeptidase ErfK/SrfK
MHVRAVKYSAFALLAAALLGTAASAQRVDIDSGSIAETVAKLRPGQFAWAPQVAPDGPMLLIVNVKKQRALLFRNGLPIAATTVSTGRAGRSTPTGVFTILQKQVEHYSSKYDNAPMPYMQRLTWGGVALHAGNLPGYPASHGCIRLPAAFARLLYGVTTLGMTVVVTDADAQPRIAPSPQILADLHNGAAPAGALLWTPERAPAGPVSIVVSAADRRVVVLRNGVLIGSAPVTVDGSVTGTWAYSLQSPDGARHWVRVSLSAQQSSKSPVPPEEWQRFHVDEGFRRSVAAIVQPGTTVVITADSLRASGGSQTATLMDAESER